MKIWYRYIPEKFRVKPLPMPTREDFLNNRNLRIFRKLRIGFLIGNPLISLIVLAVILLKVM
ncbi:MAG: hypothetical protein QXV22_03030 [Thermoplasmataceae archaeon]